MKKGIYYKNQSGIAIIMGLAFLVILTLLGVSTMKQSGLSEKMAYNHQLKDLTFQDAESAIRDSWDTATFLSISSQSDNWDTWDDTTRYDGNRVNVDVNMDITYCGEYYGAIFGSSLDSEIGSQKIMPQIYRVIGSAKVPSAGALSSNEKRGYILRPGSARSGAACN